MYRRKTRTEKIALTVLLFGTLLAVAVAVAVRSAFVFYGWLFALGVVFILVIIWSDE